MDIFIWYNSPGEWSIPIDIPALIWPAPLALQFQTSFMAEARWSYPTCIRYHDATLLKDGRVIASVIENDGTPGEPDWVWRFYTTEPVSGHAEWRIRVTGCANVS